MRSERLGVGVVGLHEGLTLLKALSHTVPDSVSQGAPGEPTRSRYATAVAGCDLDPAKRERAERAVPGLRTTGDYAALLADPDVDIVAIYTPDSVHAEQVEAAFAAGKAVICTKPLVNKLEDARRILDAGRRHNGRLQVGQSTRFFPSFARQREDFESGQIGDVEFVDAHYNHRMDWYYEKSPWAKTDTDWVFLGMSHPIDLLAWYLGPIREVHAYGTRSSLARSEGVRSFDIVTVQVLAEDGRTGRALGHYGLHELPRARNAIECLLFGSAGTSLAQYHDMRYLRTAHDGVEVLEDHLYAKRGWAFNNEVHGMHYGEFASYTDHFARAILDGTPNSPNLEEGVSTVCLMEAVRQSAETGRPVEVGPLRRHVGLDF